MIGNVVGKNFGLFRIGPGHFDGVLVRFSPGQGEKEVVEIPRCYLGQCLGKLRSRFTGKPWADVAELPHLLLYRLDNPWVSVASVYTLQLR